LYCQKPFANAIFGKYLDEVSSLAFMSSNGLSDKKNKLIGVANLVEKKKRLQSIKISQSLQYSNSKV
jgi:hypothetical protein